MCKQKNGPRADEVAIASVPFDDREAGLHLGFLQQAEQLEAAEGLTAAEIVLWSKSGGGFGKATDVRFHSPWVRGRIVGPHPSL